MEFTQVERLTLQSHFCHCEIIVAFDLIEVVIELSLDDLAALSLWGRVNGLS
jgi:hypothetical protein